MFPIPAQFFKLFIVTVCMEKQFAVSLRLHFQTDVQFNHYFANLL